MRIFIILLFIFFIESPLCSAGPQEAEDRKVPVIYCSDLFHPHDDPDDHFDIAVVYAIEEFDVRCIILDQGERQAKAPGRIPISQLNHLTGNSIPFATGLSSKLDAPEDKGLGQPEKDQGGVLKILETLESTAEPVTIIAVGSLRDVAAAYNRNSKLFHERVARLLIFIGEASADTREWNVGLDPHAFIRIMNSGLPIWWVPCFDGGNFKNKGNASYWRAKHDDLLGKVSDRIMNFFIYALEKMDEPDPLKYLESEVDIEAREKILVKTRNLWGSALFLSATQRKIVKEKDVWRFVAEINEAQESCVVTPYRFIPVDLHVDENARIIYGKSTHSHRILRFQIIEKALYPELMTALTRQLLESL